MSRYFYFIFLISILIILSLPLSEAAWQNVGGDLAHSGYSDSPVVPLDLVWKYKVGGTEISAPVVDKGTVFVGSDDNNLYAIDAFSGSLKWQYPALGRVYTPTAKDGLVFAASFDNNIYALDQDGNLKWQTGSGSSQATPPVAYNKMLFGGFDKYIYAIHIINGSIKWQYAAGDWVESTPAISQGVIYAGSNDNKIYALDPEGHLRWSYTTGGGIVSSPAVVNGIVYAGSKDNSIYAIDSNDGTLKWSRKTNDWVISSPAVFENKVFAGSNDNYVYALDIDTGDVIWNYMTSGRIGSPPVVVRGALYAGSEDGVIYVLSPENGILINKYDVGNGIVGLALSDNMLFATSRDGYVYAFGSQVTNVQETSPTVLIEKTPPVLRINPVPINMTSEKLTVSGTAQDPSGILVVTVNGVEAGANAWNSTLTLLPGQNIITIVAVDKAGNFKTEVRSVTYNPALNPIAGQETPSEKIPGFYTFYVILGLILAKVIFFRK
jgi:outer membrane protein assembly factor BamB